jgi:cob(I)alamin adenosyltransferase
MVQLTRIYTGGGDTGQTSLGDGSRVAKHDLRVAAYGTVDEANAVLGIARAEIARTDPSVALARADAILSRVQNDLFDVGADLCTPEEGRKGDGALRITAEQAARLETEIDTINEGLGALTSFILPGGNMVAAHLHHACTVARRAERLVTELTATETVNPDAIVYLNRLSDLLFVMARDANNGGADDVLWVPGANR